MACAADDLDPEQLDNIVSDVSALEPGVPGDVLSLLEQALAREYRAWDFYQAAAYATDQEQLRQALHDLAFQERSHAVSVEQMISQEVMSPGPQS